MVMLSILFLVTHLVFVEANNNHRHP